MAIGGDAAERLVTLALKKIGARNPSPETTVLVYHGISANEKVEDLFNDSVTRTAFEAQMRFLRENSYNVMTLRELVECKRAGGTVPLRAVVITFDDGYKNLFSNAYPILRKYEFPFTVFIATGYIGTGKPFPWLVSDLRSRPAEETIPMDWEEVAALHNDGNDIGSHTAYHAFLPAMDNGSIEKEVFQSRDAITEKTGKTPTGFALPFSYPLDHRKWIGFKRVLKAALLKAGFDSCCTMVRGHDVLDDDYLFFKRIPVFRADDMEYFEAKLKGFYAWTNLPQSIYQKYFKKYRL